MRLKLLLPFSLLFGVMGIAPAQTPNIKDFGTLDYLFNEIETTRILPRMPALSQFR